MKGGVMSYGLWVMDYELRVVDCYFGASSKYLRFYLT